MSDSPASGSIQPWHTLDRERVLDCGIFEVDRVRRRSPDGEKSGTFYVIGSKDWVNILAVTEDDQMVMIRQYRHGTDEVTLEIPGGILDEGESPADAALRELEEETGYVGREAVVIGRVAANPAFLDNYAHTVLVTGCRQSGKMKLDEHEDISVELRPVSDMDLLLTSGELMHSYVALAFMWYGLHNRGNGARTS